MAAIEHLRDWRHALEAGGDAGAPLLSCSGAYADTAKAADALASQVLGLQDWVRMAREPAAKPAGAE